MAIFPATQNVEIQATIVQDRGINFLFNFNDGDFVLKDGKFIELSGDAGVVFWIEKTLRTEYEKSAAYRNTLYGTVFESLKGTVYPKEVAKNIFENNIKFSLLKHERIKSIDNFEFAQEKEQVTISFEVELNVVTEALIGAYGGSKEGFTKLSTLEEIKNFLGIKLLTNNRFYFKTNLGQQVYLNI